MACVAPEIILQAGGAAAGALAPELDSASVGLAVSGLRRVAREGSQLLVSLSGHLEEVLARLNRYEGVAFEVLDQTLEDIFVEYAAGEEISRGEGEND